MEYAERRPSNLEQLKEALSDVPGKMEAEYERIKQSWTVRFRTRLTPVSGFLDCAFRKGEISKDAYNSAQKQLNELIYDVGKEELRIQKEGGEIDDKTKQDFLQRIQIG